MASHDLPPPPANHKDDEQVPVGLPPANASGRESKPGDCPVTSSKYETGNGEAGNSTPPATGNDTEATNKRKRDAADADVDDNEVKISAENTQVADTTDTRSVQTSGIKEVEMEDAEAIDELPDQGVKEVEMQDAEVVYNRTTHVEEKSNEQVRVDVRDESKSNPEVKDDTESKLNAKEGGQQDEGIKETEKPAKVDESESNEKQKQSIVADRSDGSGQQALGEVATLLKQVQESDAKAKVEVEVKVKKMDHGAVKENGEIDAAQVSCP